MSFMPFDNFNPYIKVENNCYKNKKIKFFVPKRFKLEKINKPKAKPNNRIKNKRQNSLELIKNKLIDNRKMVYLKMKNYNYINYNKDNKIRLIKTLDIL